MLTSTTRPSLRSKCVYWPVETPLLVPCVPHLRGLSQYTRGKAARSCLIVEPTPTPAVVRAEDAVELTLKTMSTSGGGSSHRTSVTSRFG